MLLPGCGLMHPGSASVQRWSTATLESGVRPPANQSSEEDVTEAHAHYGAGVIHEMNEEPELALQEYYEAALKDPANESLVLTVSRRLLLANQLDKALELLTRAAARPGASGALYARLGVVYSRLGKSKLAVKADHTAIRKEPRLLAAYENLFGNLLQTKRKKQALALLDDAARVPGTDAEFLIGLAELYATYGVQVPTEKPIASARALAVLERAAKFPMIGPALRMKLADGFALLGKVDQAADIYRDMLKPPPEVPELRDNIRAKLANLYLRLHNQKLAAEQLEALVHDNPTDIEAYYWLGRIAYDEKRYDEAVDDFATTLLLKPDFGLGYYELARAQISASQIRQALETLKKAREKFDQNFALEYLSALACAHQKDYTNALSYFNAAEVFALARDTNALTDEFYFEFGATCERNGDYAQAEKCFEKCLQLSPDFAEALNYLGYMWAEHGEKLDRARQLIERALKADPKNAAYLDSMGWVLFRLHQTKQALDYILEAIRLSEEPDPALYDHLGDIFAALGQKDKAIEAWNKSLSLEPNDEVRKKIQSTTK